MVTIPPTNRDPRKDEFYGALLKRTVGGLVETLGEGNVEAVLLIGAPARGEATVVDTPRGPYSLSDIDLVCIPTAAADARALRLRLSRWQGELSQEAGADSKGVDVSLRTRVDLASLPALISTYEMLRSPAVLWGDPGILEFLPPIGIEEIPPGESLVLLHNRIVEELLLHGHLARATSDPTAALTVLYGTAKLALDAITALLYAERNVPAGYEERVDLFRHDVLGRRPGLEARLNDYVADLGVWARFKTRGDLRELADHFGAPTGAEGLGEVAPGLWRRYARYAEIFWREILGRLTRTETADRGLAEIAALYAQLENAPRSVVRTWKLARPGAAPEGLFSIRRLLRGALFASPRQRAYLVAVVTYLGLAGSADVHVVDDLLRAHSPFRTGNGDPSIGARGGRASVLASLALFHEALLLGRKAGRH